MRKEPKRQLGVERLGEMSIEGGGVGMYWYVARTRVGGTRYIPSPYTSDGWQPGTQTLVLFLIHVLESFITSTSAPGPSGSPIPSKY